MEIGKERDELREGARGARQAGREPGAAADAAQEGPGRAARGLWRRTELGRRRTLIEEAGAGARDRLEAMIEKEPITVILSQRGWIRAMRGHVDRPRRRGAQVQGRRRAAFSLLHAQTTDKLLLAADDGRFYTLARRQAARRARLRRAGPADDRHRGRGRDRRADACAAGAEKLLVASSDGRGFVTRRRGALAETRKGKQVVNLRPGAKAGGGPADRRPRTIVSR